MASNSTDPSVTDDDEYQATYDDEEDDERTIEEEEQLNSEDEQNELEDLEADANMPLEELLKLYRSNVPERNCLTHEEEESSEQDVERHNLHKLLRTNGQSSADDDEDDDDASDSSFEPEIIKSINVGDEYQAQIDNEAEFDGKNGESDDREVPVDELLWSSSSAENLDDETIDNFLKTIRGEYPYLDEEISLQTLAQCQFDASCAMTKIHQLPVKTICSHSYRAWSPGEIEQFEEGLREFGKNFYKISVSKCSNRTVREVVHFYYQWKKSERYQQFMEEQQQRVNRINSVTDMIEKLIEEKEQQLCTAVGVINSTNSSTTYLSNELKRPTGNPSISFVTIHQQETLKRSFDQVDHDNESNGKKSALNTNTSSTSTTIV